MFGEKTSILAAENAQEPDQLVLLLRREAGEDRALGLLEGLQTGGVARPPLGGELRPDRAAVARVVGAEHELLRLQTVNERRDVRAHAGEPLGERAQGDGLPGGGELGERAELGE